MQEIVPGLWRWLSPHPAWAPDADRDGLRSLLEPLLELPIERVLVSHGEPVLHNGNEALRECLSRPEPR